MISINQQKYSEERSRNTFFYETLCLIFSKHTAWGFLNLWYMEYDLLLSLCQTVHKNLYFFFLLKYICVFSDWSLVNLSNSQNLNPITSFSEYKQWPITHTLTQKEHNKITTKPFLISLLSSLLSLFVIFLRSILLKAG